jgi:hypothetical protein
MFDLTDVHYVKRIVSATTIRNTCVGRNQQAADLLSRCLTDTPKGTIIGIEKNFMLLNIGEHQVVLQSLVYHVGFARKPYWLE